MGHYITRRTIAKERGKCQTTQGHLRVLPKRSETVRLKSLFVIIIIHPNISHFLRMYFCPNLFGKEFVWSCNDFLMVGSLAICDLGWPRAYRMAPSRSTNE